MGFNSAFLIAKKNIVSSRSRCILLLQFGIATGNVDAIIFKEVAVICDRTLDMLIIGRTIV